MDLMYWGGPVYAKQAEAVKWLRPTKVLSIGRDGGANYTLYKQLSAADGFAWAAMARKAGIDPAKLGSLGQFVVTR